MEIPDGTSLAAQQSAAADEPQLVPIAPWYRLASNNGASSEPRRRCGSQLSADPLGGGMEAPVLDSREALIAYGFRGFITLCNLREAIFKQVPKQSGLLAIVRDPTPPEFLSLPRARAFTPPGWSIATHTLALRWVSDSSVLFLGEVSPQTREHGLRGAASRLYWPSRHQHAPLLHHGQLVWYLARAEFLEAAWCTTPTHSLGELLERFRLVHGSVPFANEPCMDTV